MSVGGLLGLWFQSLFVGLTMKALSICIMPVSYTHLDNERFIEVGPKLLADRHTDRGLLPPHGVDLFHALFLRLHLCPDRNGLPADGCLLYTSIAPDMSSVAAIVCIKTA